jgi:hypothetical protein
VKVTVGAEDAFILVMAMSWLSGRDMDEVCRYILPVGVVRVLPIRSAYPEELTVLPQE